MWAPSMSFEKPNNLSCTRIQVWRGRVGLGFVASLSILAGMTDAIGFLAIGNFVSFMSGNTTQLAVAVSEGNASIILRLSFAVLTFIAGNALGIMLRNWSGRQALPLLLLIAGLLFTAGLLPVQFMVSSLLIAVLSMGMLNAVVEQLNGSSVGLTYITGGLSRLGRCLGRWFLGERSPGWYMQLVPWVGMLVGAVLGAVLEAKLGIKAMFFSAGLAVVLGLISMKIPRDWQRDYMPS